MEQGTEIIFTRDTHGEDYLSTREGKNLPVVHCVKNTWGWQLCDALLPLAAGREIFDKPTFGSVELAKHISALAPDRITLVGLCTDICVISNAMLIKASLPEAKIIVHSSLCAGVTVQSHKTALDAMRACQIEVL